MMTDDQVRVLGIAIRQYRKANKVGQEDFRKQAGVRQGKISLIEQGNVRTVDVEEFFRICERMEEHPLKMAAAMGIYKAPVVEPSKTDMLLSAIRERLDGATEEEAAKLGYQLRKVLSGKVVLKDVENISQPEKLDEKPLDKE